MTPFCVTMARTTSIAASRVDAFSGVGCSYTTGQPLNGGAWMSALRTAAAAATCKLCTPRDTRQRAHVINYPTGGSALSIQPTGKPALHCTALPCEAMLEPSLLVQVSVQSAGGLQEVPGGFMDRIDAARLQPGAWPRTFMVSSGSTARSPPEPTSVTPSVSCDRAMEASMRSAESRPSVLPAHLRAC